MLVTMIAPEFLLTNAAGDLYSANKGLSEMRQLANQDGVDWTLTHSLLADMGGFVIIGNFGRGPGSSKDTPLNTDVDRGSGDGMRLLTVDKTSIARETHLEELLQAGVASQEIERQHQDIFHLTAYGVLRLRKSGILSKLPSISVDDINDKSKSDTFVRAISVLQITWTTVQIIDRGSKSLSISQLEIAVVAFSTCAIIIYALNWSKPKAVSVPYTIMSFPSSIPETVIDAVLHDGKDCVGDTLFGLVGFGHPLSHRMLGSPIPNDWDADQYSGSGVICLILGTAIFGGLHLAAWNFHFPTRIEVIIWRATSLFCTVYGLALACMYGFQEILGISDGWVHQLSRALSILYALARLFLLVEIFRSLLFLPPDAYKSTWAAKVPHLA